MISRWLAWALGRIVIGFLIVDFSCLWLKLNPWSRTSGFWNLLWALWLLAWTVWGWRSASLGLNWIQIIILRIDLHALRADLKIWNVHSSHHVEAVTLRVEFNSGVAFWNWCAVWSRHCESSAPAKLHEQFAALWVEYADQCLQLAWHCVLGVLNFSTWLEAEV